MVSVNGQSKRVTHVVWYLHTGHWPQRGEVIAHTTCDWPPCCEFSHLTLTNNVGNVADRDAKGRQSRGVRQPDAKLTDAAVLAMRARYAAGGVTMTALAAEYGVSYPTAQAAIRGTSWKHVTATPPRQ